MKRRDSVLILIGGHLATAPRPQKEAAAAKAAGFDVQILGTWWDSQLAEEDIALAHRIGAAYRPVVDIRHAGVKNKLLRLRQRAAKELLRRTGVATARSFGVGAREMLREASRLSPVLTMVHSEAGLWAGKRLLERGFRVGVDFEDWFSEDLPVADRKGRPIVQLKELERYMLRHADLSFTTTDILAQALAEDAGTDRIPVVIPNAFPCIDGLKAVQEKRDPNSVSFYWFSQTIGPGRGLEALAKALPKLKGNWELHLRGYLRGYRQWFNETFEPSVRDRVFCHECVSNEELPAYTAAHDVGLALEVPHCQSRDLTATNKIFEYLRCGLAVIATSTQGQVEVMKKCSEAGCLIPPNDSSSLAAVMQRYIDDNETLNKAKNATRYGSEHAWEWNQFSILLSKQFNRIRLALNKDH